MPKIQLSEKISSSRYDYHLQSSVNSFSNEIISSFFKEGEELFVKKKSYPGRWSEDKLTRQLQQEHQKLKVEIFRLFELMTDVAEATNPRLVDMTALAFYNQHLVDEALDLLNDFVAKHPHADTIFFRLGIFNYQLKHFSVAISCFQQAVVLKPNYADYHNWLGQALLEEGKYDAAVEAFLKSTQINVYFAEGYLNCGFAWLQQGLAADNTGEMLIKKVESALDSVCKLQPAFENEEMTEIRTAVKKSQWAQAVTKMKKVIEEQPRQNPMELVENFGVQCLLNHNHLQVAEIHNYIKKLSRQVQLHPGYADLNDALGVAYSMLGVSYLQEATPFFETAMQRNSCFFAARRHKKMMQNELRGLRLLINTLQDLSPEAPENRQKKMRVSMS